MGLYLRGKTWWVSFTISRHNGKGDTFYKSTGTRDEKLAKKIWAKIQTQMVESKWFDIDNAKQYTYEDLKGRFMREHAPTTKKNTQLMYQYAFKHLDVAFEKKTLAEISSDLISIYMSDRAEQGAKPATVNREFSTLSRSFSLAVRKWKWTKENPCTFVSKFEEKNIKEMWITQEQEKVLVEKARVYLHGDLADIVILGIHTGMRISEMLNLKNSQVSLVFRTVTVLDTKNGEPRTIPLNETALEMLQKRLDGPTNISKYVFTTANGTKHTAKNVQRAFRGAVKNANKDDAGIERLTPHGLRHTFGTRLAQAGKNTRQIGELMGIKNEKVLRRYTHFSVESLRNVVCDLDEVSKG